MANTTRLPTIAPLTGLRAFAAAWVVFYHFRADIKVLLPSSKPVWPLFDAGYAGVDVFFVLSGFIIAYTYLDGFSTVAPRRYGRFLWLRLARLYPVHLFTLAIFFFIVTSGSVRDIGVHDLALNLHSTDFWRQIFLVHAWGTTGNHAWNYPAWSISSEAFAYLLFPLAAFGLARVRTTAGSVIGVAASVAFNIGSFLLIAWAGYTGEIILVRIIGEFAAGCFLLLLWRQGALSSWRWDRITPVAAVLAIATTVLVATSSDIAPVVATPLYGLLIFGLAHERGCLARFLGRRSVIYAGEASYSLYMTHAVVQRFVWEALPSAEYSTDGRLIRLGVLGLYAVLLVVAAVLTYEIIEKPARRFMRRYFREPRTTEPPPLTMSAAGPTFASTGVDAAEANSRGVL
jgi:peptidoglycan/LPS O-acetylase OafA/YrhL